eukprot:gene3345-3804_t
MSYNVKHSQIYLFFLLATAFFSWAGRLLYKVSGKNYILQTRACVPLLLCVLLFSACQQSDKPDVSKINLDLKIIRFDRDLIQHKRDDVAQTDVLLKKKYGEFYDDYIHRMVGDHSYTGTDILTTLYKDKAYADLSKETDSVFPSLAPIEKQLSQSFKYIKYYYPEARIPRFISFVSGFSVQTPLGDDYMGIGLDMFLGKDSKFYKAIVTSVPVYLSRRFSPEYIVPRLTETYAHEELFPESDDNRTLLSKMIYSGKILYFMDKVLDEKVPDSVKIGYSSTQINWCKKFEGDIWGYFMENNLLYNTDYQQIQVFLSEGPFTPGVGEKNQSAPKLGIWTGWQIVKKYMEKNPQISLQQLMAEKDAQKILRIVLSGGGIRGIAHLGVLKAFMNAGIRFSHISGTSAGSIAGAFYAAGIDPEEGLNIFMKTKLLRFVRPSLGALGLVNIEHTAALLKEYFPGDRIEGLKIPLTIAATNFSEGSLIYFTKGPLIRAIQASSCIPGIFKPIMIDGQMYVDGGILNNFPVEPLLKDCDFIIGSSCNHLKSVDKITNITTLMGRAGIMSVNKDMEQKAKFCDKPFTGWLMRKPSKRSNQMKNSGN